jgi:hypothetical protein
LYPYQEEDKLAEKHTEIPLANSSSNIYEGNLEITPLMFWQAQQEDVHQIYFFCNALIQQ